MRERRVVWHRGVDRCCLQDYEPLHREHAAARWDTLSSSRDQTQTELRSNGPSLPDLLTAVHKAQPAMKQWRQSIPVLAPLFEARRWPIHVDAPLFVAVGPWEPDNAAALACGQSVERSAKQLLHFINALADGTELILDVLECSTLLAL